MRIQEAGTDDVADMIALQRAVETEGALLGYLADSPADWAERDLSYTFVARDGDRTLGFVFAAPSAYAGECVFPPDSSILEFLELMVAEEARDRGVGRELVMAVEARAREDGFTHMRVYSAAKRFDDVVRFYRNCGFKPWCLEMTRELP